MRGRKSWRVIAVLALVALLLGVAGAALAAGNGSGRPAAVLHDLFVQKLAALLGVDQDKLVSAMQEARQQALEEAVQKGIITSQQAEKMKAGRMGAAWGQELASVLGMTPQELREALAAGKTLADLAAEKGLSTDQLKEQLVAKVKEKLDQAVAEGKMTRERADAVLQHLQNLDLSKAAPWMQKHRGSGRK